jgi:hypothetical protein
MMWSYVDLAKEMQSGYFGKRNVPTKEQRHGWLSGNKHRVSTTAKGFLCEGEGNSEAV